MEAPHRSEHVPLSPGEKIAGLMAFLIVAISAWALAGKAKWVPPIFTGLAVCMAVVSVALARREGQRVNWLAFLPFALFAIMVTVSVVNLAYSPIPFYPALWEENKDWVRWLPNTVDRTTTLNRMLPWLSALLLGGALRQAAFGRRATRLLWQTLLGHGLLVAVVGAWFYFVNNGMVLGLFPDRYGYHFASFIYRNHWAAYAILLVALALGFAFSALHRWLADRGRFDAVLPGAGVALLIAFTLPMPGTRSGILVIGLMLMAACARALWLVWKEKRSREHGAVRWVPVACLAGFLTAAIAAGVVINRDALRPHWKRTKGQVTALADGQGDLRINLTRDTVRMAMDKPVWGWGVGSYPLVFPGYQGAYLRDDQGRINARVLEAHNDWAHLWAETGLGGLLILLVPVGVLLRGVWRTRGVLVRWGGTGVVILMTYALADFPLHSPAVLFLWVTILCTAAPPRRGVAA